MENNYDDMIDNLNEKYTVKQVQTLTVKVKEKKVEEVVYFEKKVDDNKDEQSMDNLLKWCDNYIKLGFIPIPVGTHNKDHAERALLCTCPNCVSTYVTWQLLASLAIIEKC